MKKAKALLAQGPKVLISSALITALVQETTRSAATVHLIHLEEREKKQKLARTDQDSRNRRPKRRIIAIVWLYWPFTSNIFIMYSSCNCYKRSQRQYWTAAAPRPQMEVLSEILWLPVVSGECNLSHNKATIWKPWEDMHQHNLFTPFFCDSVLITAVFIIYHT